MEQFTANEVRTESCKQGQFHRQPASDMLNAFADLLEAREKAVPVGCLTVQRFRGSDAMVNHDFDYYGSLPDGSYSLYTQSQSPPSDAERLAEALRRTCRKMKTFSRTGALDGAVAVWVDEIESAIAAHAADAAQAQAQSGSLDELLIERGSATRDVRDNRILAFVTANQAQTLLDAFGGSSAIYALIHCERGQCAPRDDGSESPEGLYVYDINYQEEGVIYLGDEDEESEPREEVPQPPPAQDAKLPNAEDFRLHPGELRANELRIARAAFRFAMAKESGR